MAEFELSQAEADALMAMEKHRIDDQRYDFPLAGDKLTVPLQSADKREKFSLDVTRGRIDLLKATYQNRVRQAIVVLRLDLNGPPHRNPDDEEIACPHLHVYKEGYGDKWAVPLPIDKFPNHGDLVQTLDDFMAFCNVTQPPPIDRGLFI